MNNTNTALVTTVFSLFTTLALADLGTNWPTEQEMAKATKWPAKYAGNPASCKKLDESLFLKYQEEAGYTGEEEYTIETQVDLNLDGACEIIAFQATYCGNKQCGYVAFQYKNNKFVHLGDIFPGEYLEPLNGWLQIRGSGYTGNYYSLHLLQYKNGRYQYIKSDSFKYDEKTNNTKYIESETYK